jgi:pilus assembly protein CpaB
VIARRWLLVLAIAAGCIAATLYYAAARRAEVVVAAHDIDVPRALTTEDVELRAISADLVPDDAIQRVEDVIGLATRTPILRGQLLLTGSVAPELADFRSGIELPTGYRAIAIPVAAVNAIGGAVLPGSRIDVLAVPVLGRAPAGRTTELLTTGAIVLDVRGDSGAAFALRGDKSAVTADRLASVVIAIAPGEEIRFADRIATSTFVLALASAR